MKIPGAPTFLDAIMASSSAPGGANADAEAGAGFDDAVREVAKDSARHPAASKSGKSAGKAETRSTDDSTRDASDGVEDTSDAKEAANSDAVAADAAPVQATVDILGRLLAGATAALAMDDGRTKVQTQARGTPGSSAEGIGICEPSSTFDGLEERLVITPIGVGAAEAGIASDAPDARGRVQLEVLHMETHFEPRADDFVIVDGKASDASMEKVPTKADLEGVLSTIRGGKASVPGNVAAGGSSVAKALASNSAVDRQRDLPMRFDEALARLSTKDVAVAETDGRSAMDTEADTKDGRKGERRASSTEFSARSDVQRSNAGARPGADSVAKSKAGEDAVTQTPSPIASMTGQIAGRVIDALRPTGSSDRPADLPPGDTHLRLTAGGAALKTLTIQLQPENLGKLEVSMRLVDGRLTLELAATEHETALILGQDRAGLKKLLEHAGFSMDDASISIVTRDASSALTRAATAGDGSQASQSSPRDPQASAGQSFADRGSGQDRPAAGGREGRTASGRRDTTPEAPVRPTASVFL